MRLFELAKEEDGTTGGRDNGSRHKRSFMVLMVF